MMETSQAVAARKKLRDVQARASQEGRALSAVQLARLIEQLEGVARSTASEQRLELGNLQDVFLDIAPANAQQASTHRRSVSASESLAGALTRREEEVLELMRWGLSNGEIAAKLRININTVKSHTKNLFSKLGVKSRTQAVLKVLG